MHQAAYSNDPLVYAEREAAAQRLADRLTERFYKSRRVDNERYEMLVIDRQTDERATFSWSFGGGLAAACWMMAKMGKAGAT